MAVKFKTKMQHKALIDITSLVDLIFLLVAFFMVTSSLGSESSITVHLPKAVQTGQYKSGSIIVSINERNEIFINDRSVSMKDLKARVVDLKNRSKKSTVVIRGDRRSHYNTMVKVIDKLNQAGIPKFAISTSQ